LNLIIKLLFSWWNIKIWLKIFYRKIEKGIECRTFVHLKTTKDVCSFDKGTLHGNKSFKSNLQCIFLGAFPIFQRINSNIYFLRLFIFDNRYNRIIYQFSFNHSCM
jgi:hypothetical protein